ncbi:hypothetical protein F5Y11DRAFT_240518 [Daldinia sp. FL1419]|nr:hypothetical protein F5Y11DRAFT_240518 [Daldinia sp. FL1419]
MSVDQFSSLSAAQQQAILDGPALAPPDGIESNFTNPPNMTAMAFAATTLCLVVSSLSVIVRLYSRFFCTRTPVIEDYLVVAAFGTYVGYIYVTYWLLEDIGFFVHQWDIRVKDMTTHLYIVHIGTNLYSATMIVMKASIPKEWCRIFAPHQHRSAFYWICHIIMVLNIIFYSIAILVENFSCFPHERIWDQLIPGRQCLNVNAILIAGASINIVLDFMILMLPQKVIWGLQMSKSKKIGVSLVFTIGLFACTSAVARLAYTVKYYFTDDKAYWLGALSLWCIAEMTCMFFIFAGPAIPAAFNGSWMISILSTTFRSWLGISKRSTDVSDCKLPLPGQHQLASPKRYLKIDGDGIPLTTMSSIEPVEHQVIEPARPLHGADSGIVFTTEFSTREEILGGGGQQQHFKNEYLWEPHAR